MDPRDALAILDAAAARAPLTRDDHWKVAQAVEVLRAVLASAGQPVIEANGEVVAGGVE